MADTLTEALTLEEGTVATPEVVVDNFLGTLVGEGKKYSDLEALAKAYHHVNLHNKELIDDNAGQKSRNDSLQTRLDDVVTELRTPSTSITDPEFVAPPEPITEAAPPVEVNDATVASAVDRVLTEREATRLASDNVETTLSMLTTFYGDRGKALEAVNTTIGEDDNVKNMVNQISKANPNAAFKFITGEQPKRVVQENTPGVNISQGAGEQVGAYKPHTLTWTECCRMRKEEPETYRTATFRKQMEDASAAYTNEGMDFYKS